MSLTPYYLHLTTPKGNDIGVLEDNEFLSIDAKLLYQSAILTDNCEYFWAEEDSSVLLGSPNYNHNLGVGWKILENEKKSVYQISNTNFYTPKKRFKCVVAYNQKSLYSAIIEIFNSPYYKDTYYI